MRQQDIAQVGRPPLFWRVAVTGTLGLLCLGLMARRLHPVEPERVLTALASTAPVSLALACLATVASFWAVAGYDLALHRHLRTGIAGTRAQMAGFAAIAIGQTVGLGIVSGALVRWRMVPELGLKAALRLSALVALSFLLTWVVLTLTVLSVLPGAPLSALAPWGLGLAALGFAAALALAGPAMPNLLTCGRLLVLAAVDCLAAGLALWLLLPGEVDLAGFLPAFLLALGAGLLSGSPAGLGAFEIVFLALVPAAPGAGLVAALLTWRAIYYAGPALIGAGIALRQGRDPTTRVPPIAPLPEIAEAGLVAQGVLFPHGSGCIAGRTRHGLVALSAVTDLARFQAAARAEARWPVLYKLAGRGAVAARQAGLRVMPLAREAWLDPRQFRLDIPARAGLRRKLRRAEAAGFCARLWVGTDWAGLARVNAAWVAARGREHGFAMGRFDPGYLAGQLIVVAERGGRVAGFASFHRARIDGDMVWTLDLLRPDPGAGEGLGHLLILAALAAAREAGVRRLSLAAVPIGARAAETGVIARLGRRVSGDAMRGLDQFKSSFAPRWQRLYIAAPSRTALLIVGAEIWREVSCPVPLVPAGMRPGPQKEYEIATGRNPWQREEDKLA